LAEVAVFVPIQQRPRNHPKAIEVLSKMALKGRKRSIASDGIDRSEHWN